MTLEATIEADAEEPTSGFVSWVTTVDHKRVGIMYFLVAIVFFAIAGLEAVLMRIQLAVPENDFLPPELYNQLFTMHGTTMVFLVGMPLIAGFGNYLVPLMIGARDVAFPRLNAFSFWLVPFGGFMLHWSFLAGGAPNAGWFSYAPLTELPYNLGVGVDYWLLALLALGIGSVGSAINIIATVVTLRAPGMKASRMPLFIWMIFVTSILIILAIPALNSAIVMLLVDRHLDAFFFLPDRGGSAVVWQHFFWIFGHPEVYILILPVFGMVSEIIPVFSRRPIFGYSFVAASTVAIGLLSFSVWAHHMFVVGMGRGPDLFFTAASLLIAVPTGVKVLSWSATMVGGNIQFTPAMLFCIGFLVEFVIGGLSGVTLAAAPIDWQVSDSYYVVAHFHFVLFGGFVFGMAAGLHYWFPKITGKMLSQRLGKWEFWLLFIGFNATFLGMHFLGFMGMPRRVFTYPDLPNYAWLNMLSTCGTAIIAVGVVVVLYNIAHSLFKGEPAGDNPWNAWTLEWASSSPPTEHNFELVPPVNDRRPLFDLAHPELAAKPPAKPAKVKPPPEAPVVSVSAFIASESMFFIMLLAAFIIYNFDGFGSGPGPLDLKRTGFFSIALFASSGTLWIAERNLRKGRSGGATTWLIITMGLGLAFLAGQAWEYYDLITAHFTPEGSLFAATFFTTTGFHGFHVFVGLLALLAVTLLRRHGGLGRNEETIVRATGYYWHFVDVVWIFVYLIIYIGRIV